MSHKLTTLNQLFKETYSEMFKNMFCYESDPCLDIKCIHSWCKDYHIKQKELKEYNDNFIGHLKGDNE